MIFVCIHLSSLHSRTGDLKCVQIANRGFVFLRVAHLRIFQGKIILRIIETIIEDDIE